ncbi:MAG TPA: OmpA family protein [Vicinamibacteria bacterium]|nr:OmpA family protein [Vicinamibacteria bacterium]
MIRNESLRVVKGFPSARAKLLVAIAAVMTVCVWDASGAQATLTRETLGLTYPEGRTISVKFLGTSRLPRASGEAKVERKRGMTEIEIELDEMKPASLFGGDYHTYVLWVASPEGFVDNTGEFILQGNRSKLNVSTPLETFGMFVTVEPHFLVETPSRFVALENTEPTIDNAIVTVSRIKYRGSDGQYDFVNESLEDMREAKGEIRPHLDSARTAVALAERAGADRFAADELSWARQSLSKTEAAAQIGAEGKAIMPIAHETIRLAVEAEKLAKERAFESALNEQRRANAQRLDELRSQVKAAADEAERVRVMAEQRELERTMEARAREAAEAQAAEARRRAEKAEAERMAAEREQFQAEQRRIEAEAERLEAEKTAAEARIARAKAREELEEALSRVAAVRDAARGLIVEIPDVLFTFGSASLTPEGRERLAKLSGVILVADGYTLSVEGHTDSVGGEWYNQELSRKRAEAVRDYLLTQRIPAGSVSATGYGESRPIASNETEEGRQRNRRVEIVVADEPASTTRVSGNW